MSGKMIAIGVLVVVAGVIIYYMFADGGTDSLDAETGTIPAGSRKPGYVSGMEVDPYNRLSTNSADYIANPDHIAWEKLVNLQGKDERFGGTITLPPEPPKWIYR